VWIKKGYFVHEGLATSNLYFETHFVCVFSLAKMDERRELNAIDVVLSYSLVDERERELGRDAWILSFAWFLCQSNLEMILGPTRIPMSKICAWKWSCIGLEMVDA
jgi:hypothetical protein